MAIRLDEKATDRFDGKVPRVSGLCVCNRPFAIEGDGAVRPLGFDELAMLVVSRPELSDILLNLAAEKLSPDAFAIVAESFAQMRMRYPRPKRNKPPG
jgi:hypothetical protein